MKKNPFLIRLMRIGKLLVWLWQTGRALHRLDNASQSERKLTLKNMSLRCLNILNVKTVTHQFSEQSGVLIAANHISWLDIFVLCSLYPSSFIAAKELKDWFVIGKMMLNAGTVFIDRNNRKDVAPINNAIANALAKNQNICFFPEAKTSLGSDVLPLKAALFQAAINSQKPVQPVALRYFSDGKRTTDVSFAGRNLLKSLWLIVSLPEIEVQVDSDAPFIADADRFAAKDKVEAFLREKICEQ